MAQQKFLIYFSSVACVFIASVAPDVGSDEVRRASGAWRERRPVFPKAQEIGDAGVCEIKEVNSEVLSKSQSEGLAKQFGQLVLEGKDEQLVL
jgi:hypothetical protein